MRCATVCHRRIPPNPAVELGEAPSSTAEVVCKGDDPLAGVVVKTLDAELRARFNVPRTVGSGVVVVQIRQGCLGQSSGLEVGDVVTSVGEQPIASAAAFREAVAGGDAVVLRVIREGHGLFLALGR